MSLRRVSTTAPQHQCADDTPCDWRVVSLEHCHAWHMRPDKSQLRRWRVESRRQYQHAAGQTQHPSPTETRRVERAVEDLDCTPTRCAPTGVHKSQVLPECMTASPSHLPRPVLQMPTAGQAENAENASLRRERETRMRLAPDPDFAFTNPKSCPLDPAGSSGPAGVVPWIEGWGANAVGLGLGGNRSSGRPAQDRDGSVCGSRIDPLPHRPLSLPERKKGRAGR